MDGQYEDEIKAKGFNLIVGVDEAGRGPLAGPVVAAAVALKDHEQLQSKVDDSKALTPEQREKAFREIYDKAYVGVGIMSEAVIDRSNILEATFLAMANAVENLVIQFSTKVNRDPAFFHDICLLIDGPLFKTQLPYKYQTIVQGDKHVLSIACASIVAKVTRDRILNVYDKVFPEYGFRQHKGYATLQHRRAIDEHGFSLIHRRTFKAKLTAE
ncbi:MAG: ribonuclease HII [Omnitrophica WOR_2 bacterium RIFCSPHIGHO2_02_FULL_52_10]|nr:MAG: ribonuclease HII [Omnitrophica WOR_2 bacterium RIFCSPHIGHO2_02_FULL_52_10]